MARYQTQTGGPRSYHRLLDAGYIGNQCIGTELAQGGQRGIERTGQNHQIDPVESLISSRTRMVDGPAPGGNGQG